MHERIREVYSVLTFTKIKEHVTAVHAGHCSEIHYTISKITPLPELYRWVVLSQVMGRRRGHESRIQ